VAQFLHLERKRYTTPGVLELGGSKPQKKIGEQVAIYGQRVAAENKGLFKARTVWVDRLGVRLTGQAERGTRCRDSSYKARDFDDAYLPPISLSQ